jgi:hypothetical protein
MVFLIAKKTLEDLENGRTKMIQLFRDELDFRTFDFGQELTSITITENKNKPTFIRNREEGKKNGGN